ncbi:MAG: tetratricopeptide repeat protein [Magnetococcales bacterium]|nr:tetratricopeptide repeat protein [Magnetococcales bacterium]
MRRSLKRQRKKNCHTEALLESAFKTHRQGNLDQAEILYRSLLDIDPRNPQALHLSGMLASERGQHELALERIGLALTLKPDFPEACNNLGHLLTLQGRWSEAASWFQKAIVFKPDFVAAHYNLGNVRKESGQWDAALASYAQALRIQPDFAEACLNSGSVCHFCGAFDEARNWYQKALTLRPEYPEAWINLGLVLQSQGHGALAIEHYRQALVLRPNDPEALSRWGIALQDMGSLEEAIEKYREALSLRPDYPEALSHLGGALVDLDCLSEAMVCLERSLALRPRFAPALCNLGSVHHKLGAWDQARTCFAKAREIDPGFAEARFGEGLVQLLRGDYSAGWSNYEWRWKTRGFKPHGHRQPLWQGEPLLGRTVLVHCEQGFGDSIQWIRFVPALKNLGADRVILYGPSALERLFSRHTGIDLFVTRAELIPPCDFQVPLMSLTHRLAIIGETIPVTVPYLEVDRERMCFWRRRLAEWPSRLKVGLTWRGNPRFKNDRNRSMDVAFLEPLLAVEGSFFVGLQKDRTEAEIDVLSRAGNFIDVGGMLGDFADTAAIVAALDVVITVDTAVLHLAGALGCPTWGLIPCVPDWRWLLDRTDTPWYPTVRLFRQPWPGAWIQTIDEVGRCLGQEKPRRNEQTEPG